MNPFTDEIRQRVEQIISDGLISPALQAVVLAARGEDLESHIAALEREQKVVADRKLTTHHSPLTTAHSAFRLPPSSRPT